MEIKHENLDQYWRSPSKYSETHTILPEEKFFDTVKFNPKSFSDVYDINFIDLNKFKSNFRLPSPQFGGRPDYNIKIMFAVTK